MQWLWYNGRLRRDKGGGACFKYTLNYLNKNQGKRGELRKKYVEWISGKLNDL